MPPKYINQRTLDYLARCFPGLVPAAVIEEALREKAVREGRLRARPRHTALNPQGKRL